MYLLIWMEDGKVRCQRFKNLNEMVDIANQKEEVIAHAKILSPIDMINENAKTSKDKQETSILEDMLSIKKLSDEILDKDAKTPEELDAIVNNRPQP